MPAYDSQAFRPPAPVATVDVLAAANGDILSGVAMLVDSGADVSLLPRAEVAKLIDIAQTTDQYELEGFDGSRSMAPAARLEIRFLGKSFRGQFLLVDTPYGALGRNILNSLSIVLDGPTLTWTERH